MKPQASDIKPTLPRTGSGVKAPVVNIYVPSGYKNAAEFLRDCQFEQATTGDLFNELVRRLNYDGPDTASLTLGEIAAAVDGAVLPPRS